MVQSIKKVRERNARAQAARSERMRALGYVRHPEWVRAEDIPALRHYAGLLRERRVLAIVEPVEELAWQIEK